MLVDLGLGNLLNNPILPREDVEEALVQASGRYKKRTGYI